MYSVLIAVPDTGVVFTFFAFSIQKWSQYTA
jgi:hypothetical protein